MIYGTRTKYFDIALAEVRDNISVKKDILGIGRPKAARKVTWNDVLDEAEVKIKGKTNSNTKVGNIINKGATAVIGYPDGNSWRLENLIVMGSRTDGDWQPITQGGDSGAVVIDKNLNVLGMVVATGEKVSYAIPMPEILEHAGIEIA